MQLRGLFGLLCFSCSFFCFTEGKKVIRTRRQSCEIYTHNNLECCKCPIGLHIVMHCTTPRTDGKCEVCLGGFKDHANGDEKCESCTICEERANMMVKKPCTSSSNTVCGCKEGHYCDKGADCAACYTCDKCEDTGVKFPCTSSNNTVCHEKSNASNSQRIGFIAAGALALLFLVVVFFLWKFCIKASPVKGNNGNQECPPLIDIDLGPFLPEIAQTLGWRAVRNVARSELTEVDLENAGHDNPNDTAEKTYKVLMMWYEKHGLAGAYKDLISNLSTKGNREKVQQIVTRGQERHEEIA